MLEECPIRRSIQARTKLIKAAWALDVSGQLTVADDSGLAVDVLDGAPGVISARFAGPDATDEDNNAKLVGLLRSYPDRTCRARFRCVIALLRHAEDPMPLICDGTWEGVIALTPSGRHGFGYDPHFYLPTLECSAADLDPKRKDELSHRGQALAALRARVAEWLS